MWSPPMPPLVTAAEEGNVAEVERLLQAGEDVGATTANGCTALHKAARSGHTAVVQVCWRHRHQWMLLLQAAAQPCTRQPTKVTKVC
jgi:ankyrin repeat protein